VKWFGRNAAPATPLPATDDPELAPRAAPKRSAAREQAIATVINEGKAKSVRHALFLQTAGTLALPD